MKRVGRRGRVLGTVRLEGDMLNDVTQNHLLKAAGISSDMLEEMSGEERKQTLTAILESSPFLQSKCVQDMLLADEAEIPTPNEGSDLDTWTTEKPIAATKDMARGEATQSSKRPAQHAIGRDGEEAQSSKRPAQHAIGRDGEEAQRYNTETCEAETQSYDTDNCEEETQRYETQTCEEETNIDILQQKLLQDTVTKNQIEGRHPDKTMFSSSFYMPQHIINPDSYTQVIKLMLDMYRHQVSRAHKHTAGVVKAWGTPVTAGPHMHGCLVARLPGELVQQQETAGRRALRSRLHKEKQEQISVDSRQSRDPRVSLNRQHWQAEQPQNKVKVHHVTGSTSMVSCYWQSAQGGLDESFDLNEEDAASTRKCEADDGTNENDWLCSVTSSRTVATKASKVNTNGRRKQLQVSQSTQDQNRLATDSQATNRECVLDDKCNRRAKKMKQEVVDKQAWIKHEYEECDTLIPENECDTLIPENECDTLIPDKSGSLEKGSVSSHLKNIYWIEGESVHLGARDGGTLDGRLVTSHSQKRHFTASKNVASDGRTGLPSALVQVSNEESSNERTLVPANVSSNERTWVPANVSSNERTLVPANVSSNERTLVPANVSSNERTWVPAKLFQHDGYNHSPIRTAALVISDINSSSQSSESLLDSNGNLYGTQTCRLVSGLLETVPSANLLQQNTRTAQMSAEYTAEGLGKNINDQLVSDNKSVRQKVDLLETQIRTPKAHSQGGSTQLLIIQSVPSGARVAMKETVSAAIVHCQATQTNSQSRKRKLLDLTRTDLDKSNIEQTLCQKKQKVSKKLEESSDKSASVGGDVEPTIRGCHVKQTDQRVGSDDSTANNLSDYYPPIGKSTSGSHERVIMSDNTCPLCGKCFPPSILETHASSCGEDIAVESHQDKHTPCVGCKLQIPSNLILDHQAICLHRRVPEKRITRSTKE